MREISRSISRARDEHLRNLQEISKINDSVKYSPGRKGTTVVERDNLNQKSVDTDDLQEASIYQSANRKKQSLMMHMQKSGEPTQPGSG